MRNHDTAFPRRTGLDEKPYLNTATVDPISLWSQDCPDAGCFAVDLDSTKCQAVLLSHASCRHVCLSSSNSQEVERIASCEVVLVVQC
jgi:hypothetical protein